MCQSWLHFLMHHQQMWLLWVPFHRATPPPPSAKFSLLSSVSPHPPLTLRTHTYVHPCRHHLLTSSSISFSNLLPPLTYFFGSVLISSTSCLEELFLAPRFPMFALSGIHFMSIYSLVKYHKRVALWEIWTAVEKNDYSPKRGSSKHFVTALSTWIRSCKNNYSGGMKEKTILYSKLT